MYTRIQTCMSCTNHGDGEKHIIASDLINECLENPNHDGASYDQYI